MKLTVALLFPSIALAQIAASAQTTPAAKPHAATATHPTAATHTACAKLPDLSPKIPALPTGVSLCAKALYTLTTVPNVKYDYVSPLEGSALNETLGIESTTFSLNYIDTKVGTGELAQSHKWYSIQYTGYLVDGTKFDSSLDKADHAPFTFPYGQHQVIAGWDTGFAGMRVGGKRRLFIPYQLAYGPNGRPPQIPGKSMLIFDVEFLGQSDTPPAPKTPPTPPAASRVPMTPPAVKPATPPAAAAPSTPSQPATAPAATSPAQPSTAPTQPAKPE